MRAMIGAVGVFFLAFYSGSAFGDGSATRASHDATPQNAKPFAYSADLNAPPKTSTYWAEQRAAKLQQQATNPGAGEPRGGFICGGSAQGLLYPLNGTYSRVNFLGPPNDPNVSRPAEAPYQNNDDDSATVTLPFVFDFYGNRTSSCFVNNNGNLSFGQYFPDYVPDGFPLAAYPMVAPFWGDVDTGGFDPFFGDLVQNGDVWQKFFDGNSNGSIDTLVVTWDNVGYFNQWGDLRNTFQVAISDGTNPTMGLNNNVCFSYDNMCWTTGDASGGSGGFGGSPATVGANKGDGANYFQIGLFDHPGRDFDGPVGAVDGVDYLDGQRICFSTTTNTTNIPPIPVNFPPGNQITIDAGAGQSLNLALRFLSPESNQTTNTSITDINNARARGLNITNTPGNVVNINLTWTPACTDRGDYVLHFTAIDSFVPPGVTQVDLTIHVICNQPQNIPPIPVNFPASGEIRIDASAGQTLSRVVSFLSPEAGQVTTAAITDTNGAQAAGLTIGNTPGNVALISLNWAPTCANAGTYTLSFRAQDNFSPPGVTNIDLRLVVECACTSPTITQQPNSAILCAGGSVLFSAAGQGTPAPSFQWRLNGVGIPGETGQSYSINPASDIHSGNYDVQVSNSCGSVISDAATLVVWPTATGDANGDGLVDGLDIDAFVKEVVFGSGGQATLSSCGSDMNADGAVTYGDLALFIAALTAD